MAKHTSLERDPVMGPHPPHPHDTEAHTENDLHLRHLGKSVYNITQCDNTKKVLIHYHRN